MHNDLDNKIAQLSDWSREKLIAEWRRIHTEPMPKVIKNQLLIRMIAHRWQEQAYGGLSQVDQKLLEKLIRAFEANPGVFKPDLQIKHGTRLRRLWKGKIYEVTAAQDGFILDGIKYGSLSEIARHITGTRWNGRLFFGLKSKSKAA